MGPPVPTSPAPSTAGGAPRGGRLDPVLLEMERVGMKEIRKSIYQMSHTSVRVRVAHRKTTVITCSTLAVRSVGGDFVKRSQATGTGTRSKHQAAAKRNDVLERRVTPMPGELMKVTQFC